MAAFMVERYSTGLTSEELEHSVARLREEADFSPAGGRVRHIQTAFIPEEEAVLTLFEGSSREEIEELNRRAGIQFARIVQVVIVDGGPVGEGRTSI